MERAVVSFLLKNMSQLLAHQAKLLFGVEDRVISLYNELEIINAFLKSSEGKNKGEVEQKILSQIRDVAYMAEDVIDTFITEATTYKKRNKLRRMLHGAPHTMLVRDVAQKIEKIKTIIKEIHDNRAKYDVPESCDHVSSSALTKEEEMARLLHRRRRNVEEKDVVGFVHDSEVVIKRLMEGRLQRKVVSVIGMGGLGKTTLARKVFNNNGVKRHFNCMAWVYVSNECRAEELLVNLLKHFVPNAQCEGKRSNKNHEEMPRDFSSLTKDELKQKVSQCLHGKKYLLVLDDLWKIQDWDELQDAFPDDNKGNRILITTRLNEVALHTSQGQGPPYELKFLTNEQSWELFSRKVFWGEECPSVLETLGKDIVKGCRGLPLSIVVLAGLLANKEKSEREWSKVVGHVNYYVTQDETQVKNIVLKLSYDNLPARLKPCFLYMGIFLEDSEIHVRQLLQRWVAEGFIQETGSRDPDDVAEDYLYELIDRSLIQVAEVNTSGGVKTCRVHDLLRDLCMSESKEEKFFEVCMDNNIPIPVKPRRLSIHCSMSRYSSSNNNDHSCVRSLFHFGTDFDADTSKWKWLSKGFKLVRVLDLEKVRLRKNPSGLGNFIHLRYLRIQSRENIRIPASICTLQNLQTLDVEASLTIDFPGNLWKLKYLRHLHTNVSLILCKHHLKPGGEVMWNLQTISLIKLNRQATNLIKKGMFPKLRKLGFRIASNCNENVPEVLLSLKQLSHLNELRIFNDMEDFGWKRIGYSMPHEMLQNIEHLSQLSVLEIVNAKDCLSRATRYPSNITMLTLSYVDSFNDVGMNALGNLTKLRIFIILGSLDFEDPFDLNCIRGFAQLQVFQMQSLPVKNWKLTSGAMSLLQSLVISDCSSLVSLPDELWSLTALRKVLVRRPSKKLARMLHNWEMKNGSDCELIVC